MRPSPLYFIPATCCHHLPTIGLPSPQYQPEVPPSHPKKFHLGVEMLPRLWRHYNGWEETANAGLLCHQLKVPKAPTEAYFAFLWIKGGQAIHQKVSGESRHRDGTACSTHYVIMSHYLFSILREFSQYWCRNKRCCNKSGTSTNKLCSQIVWHNNEICIQLTERIYLCQAHGWDLGPACPVIC